MESEYDRKFEEMKMYIPFLDDMITRLETTSTSSANPRQAQLDKIRSLRDLLLDKKKRMKMDNLLKCEQVLVNLYAKVEQKDTLPGIKKASEPLFPSNASTETQKTDLNSARSKLMSIAPKIIPPENDPNTLPEIAPASETEVVCTPGSKEPALFQRRPNKNSRSPTRESTSKESNEKISPQKIVPKRNYTRVLVSPEPSPRRWTPSKDPSSDKPLFSRRSPRRSTPSRKTPKKSSPQKKEKKKISKSGKSKAKNLNITLNVPEESLDSLNTGDILSRIIKCPDNDVDIDTLRDLRTQILGELKLTGANDDISDLILKSYKKKKTSSKPKEEIEEGELSDSESEVIESVYGSLVVVNKDKTIVEKSTTVSSSDTEKQARKIQICLVINKEESTNQNKDQTLVTDFEMFDIENKEEVNKSMEDSKKQNNQNEIKGTGRTSTKSLKKQTNISPIKNKSEDILTIDVKDDDDLKKISKFNNESKDSDSSYIDISSSDTDSQSPNRKKVDKSSDARFKANFYNEHKDVEKDSTTMISSAKINLNDTLEKGTPNLVSSEKLHLIDTQEKGTPTLISSEKVHLNDTQEKNTPTLISSEKALLRDTQENDTPTLISSEKVRLNDTLNDNKEKAPQKQVQEETNKSLNEVDKPNVISDQNKDIEKPKHNEEIPLLNTGPDLSVPSKKDVVSEIDILQALKNEILSESIAIPGSDAATPLLHQPKVTKVASAQEIMTKKRISIEKYKQKSVTTPKASLFVKDSNIPQSSDSSKKPSLKLTEQEQQRFNFLPLPLDSSDEEDKESTNYTVDDIYGDLAPKSPENNDGIIPGSSTPIIIPVEPVKPTTTISKSDVDMRTMVPILSPTASTPVPPPASLGIFPQPQITNMFSEPSSEKKNEKQVESRRTPLIDPRVRRDLNKSVGKDSPNAHGMHPERPPRHTSQFSSATSNMNPNMASNINPNMTPIMTPNSRSFEMTPSRQSFDLDDSSSRKHVYAPFPNFEPRDQREQSMNRDAQGPRWEPNPEPPVTEERKSRWDTWKDSDLRDSGPTRKWDDRDQRGRLCRESRYDHEKRDDYSYTRMDCPRTPVHAFGRSDCPATPTPSFGRIDAPNNLFGRSECPSTPIHPFGRSDCPTTPSHPFGRSDCPATPSHPFGRSDCPATSSHPFGRSDCPTTPIHPFGRTDCPLTPSHPFGRSEMPMTPNHPFGRSDISAGLSFGRNETPMTPSHPFGRSEAPITPSHPFGRSDTPMTPSHPFGRSDIGAAPMTPSHPFGRSDFQQNTGAKVKDPRLNRVEYESKSRKFDEERDRGYYKDRRKSDLSNKTYNSSDSYQSHREQSIGRNERTKYNSERTAGREPSVGRNLSRDYENERLYTRDRGGGRSNEYRNENEKGSRNYNEVSRSEYQRGQSVGRSGAGDDRFRRSSSSSRGPNDNKKYTKQSNDNTLSVKPQSGRSFTIDTSVNTTFQEFLNGKGLQVFDYSFDSRRQRAASVGRALTRESSVGRNFRESSIGRTLPKPYAAEQDTSGYKRMVNFVRAKSMGRELVDKTEKSFKEIKADLKSYKSNYTPKNEKKNVLSVRKSNYQDPRSRKNQYEKQMEKKSAPETNKKTAYSPRKNYRDPRMHRDQHFDSKNKSRYEDNKKKYGIVYSSDNIAKGTILGSGYGVKNYRIPKIKKPIEENETKDHSTESKVDNKKEKLTEKPNATTKEIEVAKKVKEIPKKVKIDVKKSNVVVPGEEKKLKKQNEAVKKSHGNDNKRLTRRSKLAESLNSDEESLVKTRKTRKAIIDSESESEVVDKEMEKNETPASPKQIEPETKDEEKLSDKKDDNILNSSFGIDDLAIFPENLNADPVLDNINALIADLDNDIDATKTADFMKDISFDNMFESIDSPEVNMDESLKDISKVINDLDSDTIQTEENSCKNIEVALLNPENKQSDNYEQTIPEKKPQSHCEFKDTEIKDVVKETSVLEKTPFKQLNANSNVQDNTVQNSNQLEKEVDRIDIGKINNEVNINNDAVVSTTEVKQDPLKKPDELNEDRSSTPDSTIDNNLLNKSLDEEGLPDSTYEKNEMHPDVSSTRDQTETLSKDTEISSEKESSISSIGNLLSILQDKSKIKELLSMLGDNQSGENDKIKKKLEKLSEIVSDDDDTTDCIKDETAEKAFLEESTDSKVNNESTEKSDVTLQTHEDNESFKSEKNLNISDKTEHPEVNTQVSKVKKQKKTPLKRGKKGKWKSVKQTLPTKRITRSGAANKTVAKPKKPSRELKQLQESIKEMFMKDDILNATGIRMCRLSKLVDEKNMNQEESTSQADPKPVVVIEKFKDVNTEEKQELKSKKKPGPKGKTKPPSNEDNTVAKSNETKTLTTPKYKPGPKSKTKIYQEDSDPYSFDDSISEATTAQTSEHENESETEDDSLASLKSFGSSEALAELKKKPKRKKRGWQSGIIKKRRRKNESKQEEPLLDDSMLLPSKEIKIPDMNCYTDKSYCFLKNISEYPCRLCEYNGPEIVKHYKIEHPHTEIPLSRMNAVVAREAVEQCEDINLQAISKMPTDKYICRFCFDEFGRKQNALEEFFWHVVSMHTGEYKRLCSECINLNRCSFNLDIPPPPKDLKGQLIGYICGKCNFTQVSLENLKTHVIIRHNDEQTAVYTINMAVMSKKTITSLMKRCNVQEQARVVRSLRSTPSATEICEPKDHSDEIDVPSDVKGLKVNTINKNPVKSKLAFESDDNISETTHTEVKVESAETEHDNQSESTHLEGSDMKKPDAHSDSEEPSSDILDCPHFKVTYTNNGAKEYVCCVNGVDNHYKTNLLISMKKHVQIKHSEIWDGYCSVCKVIVMPQGVHLFKECLQHMLDKHMDNFPVLQEAAIETLSKPELAPIVQHATPDVQIPTSDKTASPQTYINVRPLTDLLTSGNKQTEETLPKIQSVISLGNSESRADTPEIAPPVFKCPMSVEKTAPKPEEPYKYEEMQTEVMSMKHLVILQSMLSEEKLVHIFKCAGRYCSFTTDSADAALLHASTHQRIGGENALLCSYCDYDCKGNAIDLVMHVFKMHGRCPYVCGHCFYRAVASQLVLAHIHRVHGGTGSTVLETATVTPVDDDSADMLPREVAVQHYACADGEKNVLCKFRTYTQGKFIEHLTKHKAPYLCYNCSVETNHPTELLHHMKSHGLKLYQCTWCVEGGDNEGDFLAHSSARHPTRQPQAYLRIITNNQKGGASKTMVLPLAKLNKSSVPTRLVTPQSNTTYPAREAEKALDMEKLIAAMPTLASDESTQDKSKTPVQIPINQLSPQSSNKASTPKSDAIAQEQSRMVTPPPSKSIHELNASLQLTPVLKTEPIDENPENSLSNPNVICLDSDEEDSRDSHQTETDRQNVIDLSDDDRSLTSDVGKYKKISQHELYKCQRCKVTFRTLAGFKRHVNSCFYGENIFPCGHCSFKTEDVEEFYNHYNLDHHDSQSHLKPLYSCGQCSRVEKNLNAMKNHAKRDHGLAHFNVVSQMDGHFLVTGSSRVKPGPKRKLSGGSAPDNLPKRIRYGAQDLDKLPQRPILDELAYCSECEFSTKVRLNLVRHIQQHADNQLVPQTAPVNPVPHLETNEKHFDRMINLASSSLELGRAEKSSTPLVTLHIPPEAASRYPKYVPDRQRHTCGAKGCSYISVDEAMLKCHWETLHAGSNDFHCVHCPPYQYLDTSKPLTASRIIAHLKMHDIRLYACSSCTYYHYRKQVLEKHLAEVHKGAGQIIIVREESTNVAPVVVPQVANTAPTMDLKPWKCGLCAFKSMLRPEVIEHCSKNHNTKMQFKCPVCPFRTSALENVTKHQANSHPGNNEDVFYYYYREGSIPDEKDGTPRWVKQRQKMGNPEPEVKTEEPESAHQSALVSLVKPVLPATTSCKMNLDIVKKEVVDPNFEESMDDLCEKYGEICDPNGLKFKCPLCKLVTEDMKESMQSHLYEELQYRKWACSICCYKAFHKTGLNDHMITEHRQSRAIEPIELDADTCIERWVNKVLDHQAAIIESNKSNLAKQKIHIEKPSSSTSSKTFEKVSEPIPEKINEEETENLIQAFGQFGAPNNINFCCPKCAYQTGDENAIKDHLEIELNKIRWRCSSCWENLQNYHEAQLHSKTCKSSRPGQMSRPVEAIRDPVVRAAWLAAVIRTQKLAMKQAPEPEPESQVDDITTGPLENSLLVVRYEERVPTPEVEMISRRKRPAPVSTATSPDSDEERLVIDEPLADESDTPRAHEGRPRKCSYCPFATKYQQQLEHHILRHYQLKPMMCCYCEQTCYYSSMENHNQKCHPDLPKKFKKTPIPSGPPLVLELVSHKSKCRKRSSSSSEEYQGKEDLKKDDSSTKLTCLVCEMAFSEAETKSHTHNDKPTYFAKKGDVVVKCCVCLSLFPNINLMQEHNSQCHPNMPINYAFFKLNHNTREILQCGHCSKRFKFFKDLKTHHNVVHSSQKLKFETRAYYPGAYDFECESESKGESSKTIDNTGLPTSEPVKAAKRVARKSTTKLPKQTVARKSTTKLPFNIDSDSDSEDEYSYYGNKPASLEQFENVTTLMPMFNTMISLQKLSEIIKINPVVAVKDCKK